MKVTTLKVCLDGGERWLRMSKVLCGECGSVMVLREGCYGKFYGCSIARCDGTHSAHPSGKPLGIPANKELRLLRVEAHKVFDEWCILNKMSRSDGYKALQGAMGLSSKEAHFGRFDKEQCLKFLKIKKTNK